MIYKVYYSNIKLQSQIVVPVQTNKAQVCPHIWQPASKKKQKKHRKASAQSRVAFFFLLIGAPFVLIKHWQSSGGRNVANKSSQILCCCYCRVHTPKKYLITSDSVSFLMTDDFRWWPSSCWSYIPHLLTNLSFVFWRDLGIVLE